jgi:annexin A7/11
MRDGLLYIAKGAENDGQGIARDAEMLEVAMSKMGTKDERLSVPYFGGGWIVADSRIYRIVRAHWNRPRFTAIKNHFQSQYRTSLRRRVEGETTGKYEKALVAIVEQMWSMLEFGTGGGCKMPDVVL